MILTDNKIEKTLNGIYTKEGVVSAVAKLHKLKIKYTWDYKAYFISCNETTAKTIIDILARYFITPCNIDNYKDMQGNVAIYFN